MSKKMIINLKIKEQKVKMQSENKKLNKPKTKFEISAGGVVYRKIESHDLKNKFEILVIKDSYGKWALPKGHPEIKEKMTHAALREISEETGLVKLEIIEKIGKAKYFFRLKGQPIFKIVEYFLVKADPQDALKIQKHEIRDAKWLPIIEAEKLIKYKDLKPIVSKAILLLKKSEILSTKY